MWRMLILAFTPTPSADSDCTHWRQGLKFGSIRRSKHHYDMQTCALYLKYQLLCAINLESVKPDLLKKLKSTWEIVSTFWQILSPTAMIAIKSYLSCRWWMLHNKLVLSFKGQAVFSFLVVAKIWIYLRICREYQADERNCPWENGLSYKWGMVSGTLSHVSSCRIIFYFRRDKRDSWCPTQEERSLHSAVWVGPTHNVEWIPLGPKLPLIIKQQAITGAPLAWYWGVCSCVWRGPNIWFGSRRARRYKANIVMTDVWWRGSGLWKIHLSSQLKLRGGREERDMGAGRLGGYPLCGPHLGTCGGGEAACICVFVRERESEQVCVGQLDAGQMKPGSCFGSSFSPKCPYPPTLLPSPISFPRRIPHPSPFCHAARNLFPEAEATLMWEA